MKKKDIDNFFEFADKRPNTAICGLFGFSIGAVIFVSSVCIGMILDNKGGK